MQSLPTDIPAYVMDRPELVGALAVVIMAIVAYQRTLSYHEYRFAHTLKSALFAVADEWATSKGRPLLRGKLPPEQSEEFVTHVPDSPKSAFQALRAAGFSPHLVATTKVRQTDSGREFSHSQLVYIHDDGRQTETYLFEGPQGGTDVYAHVETAATDPVGHLTDAQEPGDPRGVVMAALQPDQ